MIQRIQTIFLAVAVIVNSYMVFAQLGAGSEGDTMESATITAYGNHYHIEAWDEGVSYDITKSEEENAKLVRKPQQVEKDAGPGEYPLLIVHIILVSAASAALLGAIFLYNNRPVQLKVVYIGLILLMGQLSVSLLLFNNITTIIEVDEATHTLHWETFLPAVVILLGWLASRRIRKDENLVKSMDRLR